MSLNARQAKFVAEYLKSGNATQAARDAGYGEKSAESKGCQLLRNVKIAEKIAAALRDIEQKSCISVASLMKDLEEIKKRCMQAEEVLDSEGRPTGEWQFDSRGALKAVELQGKHLGMFSEQPKPPPPRDVTPDGEEEKLTTTDLIHMILERRQTYALQIEKTNGIPVREPSTDSEAICVGDTEPEGFAGLQSIPEP